jgi:protein SCO1/2
MHKRFRWIYVASVALALFGSSCSQGGRSGSPGTAASPTNVQTYQVKGVIRELFPEKKKVKITHEDIPGYMEAMTMMLDVRDAKELAGFQPGDPVSFRMLVTEDDGWIDQLKKLDGPRTPLPAEPPAFRRVRDVEPLAVGDKLPDYTFTNTAGRVMKLSEFRGRALGLTFIFTRCPFPTFCPRLSSNFAEAQGRLKALSGGPTNWSLLSITIDPEFDTPERLKGYAGRYKADPQHWDHVTGALIDITAIGEQFGLQFWRANPNEPINHNVRTVVVDAAGRIQWVTNENEWKADAFVEQMVRAAKAKPEPDVPASGARQP